MHAFISNLPDAVTTGLMAAVCIWLLIDLVIMIRKKKSAWIVIGLIVVIVSGMLFILYACELLGPALSKYAPIGILAILLLGVGLAIYGGYRDFKRAGKKTSPAMKKFFIGWGIFMGVCVVTGIVVFIGMKLTGT